ncbi:homeobox protein Hox-A7 isoform X3 [Microcaecilia unicolor]|uniref:Homeobox protein Hox-A7 isoform X3 n=1 Tax=Microcaecilia unicolor TaxID=1415580 RepID=A0A6P7Y6A3_9AMPH|nr:homeobox protein Hox-A7 isoform X3 [Microcaecilia unicolor]
MSSSYYVNALFSKYTTGASLFQNAEPTSCSFATNSQRTGYGPGTNAFPSSMPGLYNVNSTIYQNPFSSGYSLASDAYNLHCSTFDQNIPVLCNDVTKSSCEKSDETNLHTQAESNFRIYPWMRSSETREQKKEKVTAKQREEKERYTGRGEKKQKRNMKFSERRNVTVNGKYCLFSMNATL